MQRRVASSLLICKAQDESNICWQRQVLHLLLLQVASGKSRAYCMGTFIRIAF